MEKARSERTRLMVEGRFESRSRELRTDFAKYPPIRQSHPLLVHRPSSTQLISEIGLPQVDTSSRVAQNVFSEYPGIDRIVVGMRMPDYGGGTRIPAPDRHMAVRVVYQNMEAARIEALTVRLESRKI